MVLFILSLFILIHLQAHWAWIAGVSISALIQFAYGSARHDALVKLITAMTKIAVAKDKL